MILYILGAGGHGKVVAEVATLMGIFEEIFFLDDKKKVGSVILNYKVFKNVDFEYIKSIVNRNNYFFVIQYHIRIFFLIKILVIFCMTYKFSINFFFY